jgi:hypothetical protein
MENSTWLIMQFRSHISLNKLAFQIESYPQALVFLSELHRLPITRKSGVRWVNEKDVPKFTSAWVQWRDRPRITVVEDETRPVRRRRRRRRLR